jgi:hypothetical protein
MKRKRRYLSLNNLLIDCQAGILFVYIFLRGAIKPIARRGQKLSTILKINIKIYF